MPPPLGRRPPWIRRWASALAVVLSFASCAPYRAPAPAIPGITPPAEDEDVRISREFRREARKHLRLVNDPEVERYIDDVGRRILAAMGPQPFEYRFFVVDEAQLNAFAVPGGSIYFYAGLIERAKSTSEIAGVMGHEIVHVKGRHMARSAGPDAVSLLSLLGMILLARSGGAAAQAAGAVGQAISATRQIAYGRQLEMEADTLGARYMAAAGFDPEGALGFLKTLDQERALSPIDVPSYMLTHPVTQERLANIELVIRSLGDTRPKAPDPDPLKKIQLILRMERDADKALAEQEKQVRENPRSASALHLLGFAYFLKGNMAAARENYEKAQRLEPGNPALERDLGRLYTRIGDYAAARAAFDRAIAAEPKNALTYLFLGELYEKENDLRNAAGAYLNASNLAPLWEKPPQRLSAVYGKLDRLGDAYYYLGRSYALQDEDELAIANFEKAVKALGGQSPRAQLIRDELQRLRTRKR
ncbi:MAG TPA: M48 family metalloprotease [candidate division Zixibacteria bacterium]|nr:M48 family metalloprotease [candidate division Zixibacteria bacterium]